MTRRAFLLAALATSAAAGCAKPSAANIALRKQVQTLQTENETLKRQHAADVGGSATTAPTTRPSMTASEADSLFTTHGIRLGRLTRIGDDGLKVHLVPYDDSGDAFKAAGSIRVEAFDLADAGRRVGDWTFDAAAAKPLWNGQSLRYEYVVPCPWTSRPTAKELTMKVTFVDTLTGRSFETQQVVAVPPK